MRNSARAYGTKLYEYVLLYVDNLLVVSDKAKYILQEDIGKYFELNEESIGPPSI